MHRLLRHVRDIVDGMGVEDVGDDEGVDKGSENDRGNDEIVQHPVRPKRVVVGTLNAPTTIPQKRGMEAKSTTSV